MSVTSATASKNGPHLVGFDLLRLVALGMVTLQHVFTLTGCENLVSISGFSIGQLGVALFLFLSGWLASQSRRPPLEWLGQRLIRLFPAFWLVMAASFLLTAIIGNKHFDAWQVAAQMIGIGWFTHESNLVNSPTWFISLLLVCYLGSFLARLLRMPLFLGSLAIMASAILVVRTGNSWFYSHLFTYAMASTIAILPHASSRNMSIALAVTCGILSFIKPFFAATACCLVIVELAMTIRWIPRWISIAAEYSYEYYLVHGIVFFGVLAKSGLPISIAVGVGVAVSMVFAVVLRFTISLLRQVLSQCD